MTKVKNICACLLAALILVSGLHFAPAASAQVAESAQAAPRPYFYEPSISPDRREIAFVSGGDIWTVPAEGG